MTRSTMTRPTLTRPTITRPTLTRPKLSRPTLTRPAVRRLAAAALALALFAGAPGRIGPAASAAPTLPPSVGNAVLFHLQIATDIDGSGNPIGQGNVFPEGTTLIVGLLGWSYVPAGTELRLRLFQGDRFAYETSHVVVNETGTDGGSIGFVFPFHASSGFPAGDYSIEVDYNRVPDEVVPFTVGSGGAARPGPRRPARRAARSRTRTRPGSWS